MSYKFHKAARDGYLDLLREASRKDADSPDEDGMTPTLWAAYHGNLDALRMLLGRGGDPDKCDYQGNAALHLACQMNNMNCVSYLVSFGANLWALDNDFHTALEVASLNDRIEIVKYLDGVVSKQAALNRAIVKKLKEKAVVAAEKRVKKFAKIQARAQKVAEKEEMKMLKKMSNMSLSTAGTPGTVPNTNGIANGRKGSSASLTVPNNYTGNGNGTWSTNKSARYSDLVGTASNGTAKKFNTAKIFRHGGVSKKIMNKKKMEDKNGDFKVTNSEGSGKRTITSITGLKPHKDSEVLYVQNVKINGEKTNPTSRKGLDDLFDTTSQASKAMSVPDLMYADDENAAGTMFNRPGLGAISFLHRPNTTDVLLSLPAEDLDENEEEVVLNGHDEMDNTNHVVPMDKSLHRPGSSFNDTASIGTVGSLAYRIKTDIPWNEDEIEALDDDEELHENSPLELFLASHSFSEYMTLFTKEKIDLDALMLVSDDDLKSIGLPLGPRRKILDAINKRNEVLKSPSIMMDTML